MLKSPMLKTLVRRWWDDRSGATVVEYGVIIGVLVMMFIAGLGTALNAVQFLFEDSNNKLVPIWQ